MKQLHHKKSDLTIFREAFQHTFGLLSYGFVNDFLFGQTMYIKKKCLPACGKNCVCRALCVNKGSNYLKKEIH